MEIGKIGGAICLSVLFGAQSVEGIHVGLTVEQTCEDQKSSPSTWKLKISESIKTVKLDDTARGPSGAPDDRRAPPKPGEPIGSKDLRRKDWCCQGIRMRTKNSVSCDGMHLFTIKIDKLEGKDFSKIQGSQSPGSVPLSSFWQGIHLVKDSSPTRWSALPRTPRTDIWNIIILYQEEFSQSSWPGSWAIWGLGEETLFVTFCLFNFGLRIFYLLCVWEFRLQVYLYVCRVPTEARRGKQIPGN